MQGQIAIGGRKEGEGRSQVGERSAGGDGGLVGGEDKDNGKAKAASALAAMIETLRVAPGLPVLQL